MRDDTRRSVDAWWRLVFDVDADALWRQVTVRPHRLLRDYPGWYVGWRGDGVHVSSPPAAAEEDLARLAAVDRADLRTVDFWDGFADQIGMELVGPAVHAYLDVDPGDPNGVVDLTPSDLEALRAEVPPAEWDEAGMSHDPPAIRSFGLRYGGRLVATAVLNGWDGAPTDISADIGVLVVEAARGRGRARIVGQAAASYAIRTYGVARWRAATANLPSMRIAERLGFESYATQLAVRPPRSS